MSEPEAAATWAMTNPNPRRRPHTCSADDGRIGWRWHCVPDFDEAKDKRARALCGLRPRHGWGGDLFADEMCERCRVIAVRMGLQMPDGLRRSGLAEYKEERRAL